MEWRRTHAVELGSVANNTRGRVVIESVELENERGDSIELLAVREDGIGAPWFAVPRSTWALLLPEVGRLLGVQVKT